MDLIAVLRCTTSILWARMTIKMKQKGQGCTYSNTADHCVHHLSTGHLVHSILNTKLTHSLFCFSTLFIYANYFLITSCDCFLLETEQGQLSCWPRPFINDIHIHTMHSPCQYIFQLLSANSLLPLWKVMLDH